MPRTAALLPLILIAALPTQAVAQDADDWSIEESRAPSTTPPRFTATEGTWISLDVSPDGRIVRGLNPGGVEGWRGALATLQYATTQARDHQDG